MVAKDTQRAVLKCLAHPQGIDWLKDLFWSILNYNSINRPLARHDWPKTADKAVADDPLLLAEENGFQIIYSRLGADRLRLTDERAIINRLRREHPYGLFVFSDEEQSRWHFVNVKLAGEAAPDGRKKRYLLRRISIGPEERLRTASERIVKFLNVGPDAEWVQQLGRSPSALEIQASHDEAFDVEAVTQAFFKDYKKAFHHLQEHLRDQTGDSVWAHDYALQFLNRLMFLYFIQRKRWLGEDPNFIKNFWHTYNGLNRPKDTFFKEWLSVLFFEAFNRKFQAGRHDRQHLPPEIRKALAKAPFLNGGLFKRNELDAKYRFNISDKILTELIHDPQRNEPGFFEHYNFTITETTPLDQEVAVDPEMIGRVYESLVNITFEDLKEEDLRGMAGIFYTPRIEIDLMSRLALVDCLTNYLGEGHKSLLYEAVFAYEPDEKRIADEQLAQENLWPKLGELLREITVLDPACGSGSFLVGMLLLLDDLLTRADKQLGNEETSYERRKKIIGRSLYGVDVMEWAVSIAELRLWLQLVVETDNPHPHLGDEQGNPLLPNLSFKVRPGDSLVQEVGGISFALHQDKLDISPPLKRKLTRLKGEKRKFYYNDSSCIYHSEAEIKQAERLLFQEILESKIVTLQNEIATLTRKIASPEKQLTLSGIARVEPRQLELQVESWKRQQKESEEESVRLREALHALRSSEEEFFVWDIAFVEIFEGEKQGFDIVIGNPPYVRQEKIAPPKERPEEHGGEGSEEWRKLKAEYKAKLQHSIAAAYQRFFDYRPQEEKQGRKLNGKSDYYVYFYLHGLKLLNEQGSFCFITSNSWLDVGYGKDLQEFLLKHSQVKMILDNEAKRSFARSDVNTIIALLAPVDDRKDRGLDKTARFVMFQVPFEEILHPVIFEEIEEVQPGSRKPTPDYRAIAISQRKLYEEGLALPEDEGKKAKKMVKSARYVGNKWGGKYLRAPEIFFTILEKGKGKLVRLGEIAEVRFGIKTGADSWFYLRKVDAHLLGLEKQLLYPILTSSDQIKHYATSSKDTDIVLVTTSKSKAQLRGTKMLDYIKKGETQLFPGRGGPSIPCKRPSCRNRHPFWYSIQLPAVPPIYWMEMRRERYFVLLNADGVQADHTFYGVYPSEGIATETLCAVLNSTLIVIPVEIMGNQPGGVVGLFSCRLET